MEDECALDEAVLMMTGHENEYRIQVLVKKINTSH